MFSASAIVLAQYGCTTTTKANPTPKAEIKSNKTDILIVGGGVAGLTAAQSLKANGFNSIVLEARDRMGGRIWTNNSLGVPLDLGAAWIHRSNGNPITKLAQQWQIQTVKSDLDAYWIYGSDGKQLTQMEIAQMERAYKEVERELAKLQATANESDSDSSNISLVQRG